MAQVDVENGDDENGNMRSFNVIYSSRHDLIINFLFQITLMRRVRLITRRMMRCSPSQALKVGLV